MLLQKYKYIYTSYLNATESPFKMMKNAFSFMLKAPFVLKISKFFSYLFGHIEKQLE